MNFRRLGATLTILVTLGGCGGGGDDEAASTAGAVGQTESSATSAPSPTDAPAMPTADPAATEAAAAAIAPENDPSAEAPPPTRGGEHPPFEAVPQDVTGGAYATWRASPDGRLIAFASERGTITIFDVRNNVVRASRRPFFSTYEADPLVRWDGTSRHVAVSDRVTTCVWDLQDDDLRCVASSGMNALALGLGGRRVAFTAYVDGEEAIMVWPLRGDPRKVDSAPDSLTRLDVFGDHVLASDRTGATIYSATGRHEPVEIAGVDIPRHAFLPGGRAFIAYSGSTVQRRAVPGGDVEAEVSLTDAVPAELKSAARRGQRIALCDEGGGLWALDLGSETGANRVAESGCEEPNRPQVSGRGARLVDVAGSRLVESERLDGESLGREHSLWSLEVLPGRVITHRRGGAEVWSADGVHRGHTNVSQDYEDEGDYFDGLVARSPSGAIALRVDRDNAPVLFTRATRVALRDAVHLPCTEYTGCDIHVDWANEEARLAIVHPNRVEVFQTADGVRLGGWMTGRGCSEECDPEMVCVDGECEGIGSFGGQAAFSPDGQRLVSVGADGSVGLYSVSGERLHRLAAPDSQGSRSERFAFSPDGAKLAFVRRRRLSFVQADTGEEIRRVTLGHPLQSLAFSPDGSRVYALEKHGRLVAIPVTSGEPELVREVGEVRESADGRAVTCRDGSVWIQNLRTGAERGPLGRCLAGGRFVSVPGTGLLGYVRGTLARVHRLSDGEVLNLRSVWRPGARVGIAFTDSGWAYVHGGTPRDVYVRDGDIARGSFHHAGHSNRIRSTLLADFFSGGALPEPPPAGTTEAAAE